MRVASSERQTPRWERGGGFGAHASLQAGFAEQIDSQQLIGAPLRPGPAAEKDAPQRPGLSPKPRPLGEGVPKLRLPWALARLGRGGCVQRGQRPGGCALAAPPAPQKGGRPFPKVALGPVAASARLVLGWAARVARPAHDVVLVRGRSCLSFTRRRLPSPGGSRRQPCCHPRGATGAGPAGVVMLRGPSAGRAPTPGPPRRHPQNQAPGGTGRNPAPAATWGVFSLCRSELCPSRPALHRGGGCRGEHPQVRGHRPPWAAVAQCAGRTSGSQGPRFLLGDGFLLYPPRLVMLSGWL